MNRHLRLKSNTTTITTTTSTAKTVLVNSLLKYQHEYSPLPSPYVSDCTGEKNSDFFLNFKRGTVGPRTL